MVKISVCLFLSLIMGPVFAKKNLEAPASRFYKATNPFIQYIGRVDFSNPKSPRFWAPGVYIKAKFKGTFCRVVVNDESAGNNHNYIEIVVDDQKPLRLLLRKKTDTISIGEGLSSGSHQFVLCKDTESGIGYMEFAGIICRQLLAPSPLPERKIEFIGNSITCGTGMDQSVVPCHTGLWQDQHNAYMSYGAQTARNLHAQWHLTSLSGVGLMHSCCNLEMVMGDVFGKMNFRGNTGKWNFSTYQPDVVTVCLGQNDGIQDSAIFCNNYINFIKTVRAHYPKASIICLSSPMADASLIAFLKKNLSAIVEKMNRDGDKKVSYYFFTKRYHNGCDEHPDMDEHRQIANELTAFIKTIKAW